MLVCFGCCEESCSCEVFVHFDALLFLSALLVSFYVVRTYGFFFQSKLAGN